MLSTPLRSLDVLTLSALVQDPKLACSVVGDLIHSQIFSTLRFSRNQGLNIPLVALACEDSQICNIMKSWCSSIRGNAAPETRSPPAKTAAVSRQVGATVEGASPSTSYEGGVHVAIADESYHPRQLWLAEKVGQAIPGVALYTVDSCSCCPVNTFYGERASTATKPASREDLRQAQVR